MNVVDNMSKMLAAALAVNTKSSYSVPQRQYARIAELYRFEPFPLTEEKLCFFASHEALRGIVAKTIGEYISGIISQSIDLGLPQVDRTHMPRLKRMLTGIAKTNIGSKPKEEARFPIRTETLLAIRSALDLNSLKGATLWASFTLAFFAMLRPSEFSVRSRDGKPVSAPLLVKCVKWDPVNRTLVVSLLWDKTHQPGKSLPPEPIAVAETGGRLCPVWALDNMMRLRNPEGQVGPDEHLFVVEGKPLTYEVLETELRRVTRSLGFNEKLFAGHSFRIGGATCAFAAGVPEILIKRMGRWKSDAVLLYIRSYAADIAGAQRAISNMAGLV
jgi:hypothetical protein